MAQTQTLQATDQELDSIARGSKVARGLEPDLARIVDGDHCRQSPEYVMCGNTIHELNDAVFVLELLRDHWIVEHHRTGTAGSARQKHNFTERALIVRTEIENRLVSQGVNLLGF